MSGHSPADSYIIQERPYLCSLRHCRIKMKTAMIPIIKSTAINASTTINSLVPDSISQITGKRKGHPRRAALPIN